MLSAPSDKMNRQPNAAPKTKLLALSHLRSRMSWFRREVAISTFCGTLYPFDLFKIWVRGASPAAQ